MNSYCVIDSRCVPSKQSSVDIFIFEKEYHSALYLEYSVHKQYSVKNCNDLVAFLNFNKNLTFQLQNSFIYARSAGGFKWVLFFAIIEFLIKNLNTSVIGAQFYFPLFSKYLIMNEMQLLFVLQSSSTVFMKTYYQTYETPTSIFQKKNSGCKTSEFILQNSENKTFQGRKKKNLNSEKSKSNPKLQLKRKSVDSGTDEDCLRKNKRSISKNSLCHCKNYEWKMFTAFERNCFKNYASILEYKKWVDNLEASHSLPMDCSFPSDFVQHANSSVFNQNQNGRKQDFFAALNTCNKTSPQLLDKVNESKYFEKAEENQAKLADLCMLNEIKSASADRESATENFQLSVTNCEKVEFYQKTTFIEESIHRPSKENPQTGGIVESDKNFPGFQTASGKSLKISEAALKAAEKMFQEVCSQNMDMFPLKKIQCSSHIGSSEEDKHALSFQTASGKSLNASRAALEAAEKMFREICVDIFPKKKTHNALQTKKCYPSLTEYADNELNNVLAGNFFEDIAFDDKEMDFKPNDSSIASTLEAAKTYKIRKSLGGRRSLRPYALKKQ